MNDVLFFENDLILVGNEKAKKPKLKATFGGINV